MASLMIEEGKEEEEEQNSRAIKKGPKALASVASQ